MYIVQTCYYVNCKVLTQQHENFLFTYFKSVYSIAVTDQYFKCTLFNRLISNFYLVIHIKIKGLCRKTVQQTSSSLKHVYLLLFTCSTTTVLYKLVNCPDDRHSTAASISARCTVSWTLTRYTVKVRPQIRVCVEVRGAWRDTLLLQYYCS